VALCQREFPEAVVVAQLHYLPLDIVERCRVCRLTTTTTDGIGACLRAVRWPARGRPGSGAGAGKRGLEGTAK
jgi:hypothetical protein